MKEKYGEWIAIDNDPEVEDTYLVAWLPKGMKRKECFVGLVGFYDGEWDEEDINNISNRALCNHEVELMAWTPLPETYKIEFEVDEYFVSDQKGKI